MQVAEKERVQEQSRGIEEATPKEKETGNSLTNNSREIAPAHTSLRGCTVEMIGVPLYPPAACGNHPKTV